MEIVILDTSVLLNVLRVPGKNQQQEDVLRGFVELQARGATLLVPLAAIVETGNHIGQLRDGCERRRCANSLAKAVASAIARHAPFALIDAEATDERLAALAADFPDWAMRGSGWGDLSIRQAWQRLCDMHRGARVRIWTLDRDLVAYDRQP
jgi:hypothetical protein